MSPDGARVVRSLDSVRRLDVGPVAEPAYKATTAEARALALHEQHIQIRLRLLELQEHQLRERITK